MLKNSRFMSFVLWLNQTLKNSFIFDFLEKIISFIADSYNESRLKKILKGNGEIEMYYSSSAFIKLINKPAMWIISLIDAVFSDKSNSWCIKTVDILKGNSVILNELLSFPFICCAMFVVPHDYWNNLFALAISLFLAVIALCSRSKDKPAGFSVWFCMIIFGLSIILAFINTYNPADSIKTIMFFITSFILCIAVSIYISDPQRFKKFLKWMLFALLITSAVAFYQRITGIESSIEFTDPTLNEGMPGRAFSTFGNPNNFAEFLMLFIPFAFAYAITLKNNSYKIFCLAGVIFGFGALLLTYSRSGWIAFAVALIIYIMLYNKKYLPYLIIVAFFVIPLLPQSILNRILTIGNLEDTSSSYRLMIWSGCLKLLSVHWLAGLGPGCGGFQYIFPLYAIISTSEAPHSHMQFMEIAIELGIVGFIIYLYFTFTTIRRAFAASKCQNSLLRHTAMASAAAMSGIIFIGFFEYVWFYPRVMFAFFVCLGVCIAAVHLAKEERKISNI